MIDRIAEKGFQESLLNQAHTHYQTLKGKPESAEFDYKMDAALAEQMPGRIRSFQETCLVLGEASKNTPFYLLADYRPGHISRYYKSLGGAYSTSHPSLPLRVYRDWTQSSDNIPFTEALNAYLTPEGGTIALRLQIQRHDNQDPYAYIYSPSSHYDPKRGNFPAQAEAPNEEDYQAFGSLMSQLKAVPAQTPDLSIKDRVVERVDRVYSYLVGKPGFDLYSWYR